jgi:hypothetical protein
MVLIVVMVLQFALIRNDSNIIDLTLNVRRKVLLGLGSAILCVGLSWFLVARGWGIVGSCWRSSWVDRSSRWHTP